MSWKRIFTLTRQAGRMIKCGVDSSLDWFFGHFVGLLKTGLVFTFLGCVYAFFAFYAVPTIKADNARDAEKLEAIKQQCRETGDLAACQSLILTWCHYDTDSRGECDTKWVGMTKQTDDGMPGNLMTDKTDTCLLISGVDPSFIVVTADKRVFQGSVLTSDNPLPICGKGTVFFAKVT